MSANTEQPFLITPSVPPSVDDSGAARAEFRIGVASIPGLADHRLEDMTVVPGSLFVGMAMCVERALKHEAPKVVRNVSFHRPVVLATDDLTIWVTAEEREAGVVAYTFDDADPGSQEGRALGPQHVAKLELMSAPAPRDSEPNTFSVEAFRARADTTIGAEAFYGQLRANGNQYGPRFQGVESISRAGYEAVGRLAVVPADGGCGAGALHPLMLDAMTQLPAVFLMDEGRPFVLRSIGEMHIADGDLPEPLWGHASLRHGGDDAGGSEYVGDIRIFGASGQACMELSDVTLTLLDRASPADQESESLVIAANFTAEPLEDSVAFWAHHFNTPIRAEFAPYNQVFQQLLEPASPLRKNQAGVNAILLELSQWVGQEPTAPAALKGADAVERFGDRSRYVLPNGMEIVHLNRYETDYLYKEIFEDQCYLRHGTRVQDGDTVLDIGANIGIFSLFVLSRCPNARVYAFEPAPRVYDLLSANCDAYSENLHAFNFGVSDKPGTAEFTFYEGSSVFSGFHSDEAEDRRAVEAVVRNMLRTATESGDSVEDYVDQLTSDRLRRQTQECRLTTVSDIIRENDLERVDLLKIDAEKSELDIVNGIADGDWEKIDQLVIEVHDRTREALKHLERLLRSKGYRCAVERETLLEDSGFYNLYATREEAASPTPQSSPEFAGELQRNVRDFGVALESFVHHSSVPTVLGVCPAVSTKARKPSVAKALAEAEQEVLSSARRLSDVHVIDSEALLGRYGITDYYDHEAYQAGHMPYTSRAYAAIGTELFRAVSSLKSRPFKVVVLDCDNTLWKGVVGEDGVSGIEVTEPYRLLQEFMVARMNAGMLLCLCSKNNEADVLAVLEQRSDMVLRREHLVSWRIDWNRKSDNIRALADELELGLDSFIFLDDNPLECADVRINCPEVVALQVPRAAEAIPRFLQHVWAFDGVNSTSEDRKRTRMYQENVHRRRFQAETGSLGEFIRGLQLRVDISAMKQSDLARVSQLTFRTNQFNFSTVRRSEQEIQGFLDREQADCLVVRVVDRFGDYGLVGVVLYEAQADRYRVDTFLLSCRVLGRGVEHAILAELGRRAHEDGKRFVELEYRPTERNGPVVQFVRSIGASELSSQGSWVLESDQVSRLEYRPDDLSGDGGGSPATEGRSARATGSGWGAEMGGRSEALQTVAQEWHDIGRLCAAIEEFRKDAQSQTSEVEPATAASPMQATLLRIWERILGHTRMSLNDNFFEVGGTSLRAVQVIAAIKKELRQDVSIVTLFECPTVDLLAARLSSVRAPDGEGTANAALERGRRRRNITRRGAS